MARGTLSRNWPLLTAMAATVLAMGLLAVHLWVRPFGWLDKLEGFAIDARFEMRGPRAPGTDRIVIVGIDDATRRQYPETLQTRRGYAALFDALTKYEVKVIALDLYFDSPEIILPEDLEAEVRATDKANAALIAKGPPRGAAPAPDAPPPATTPPATTPPATTPPATTPPATTPPATTPPAGTAPAKTLEQQHYELAVLLHDIAEELRGDEVLAKAIANSKKVFLGAFFRSGKGKAREAEPAKLALARHGESADSGAGGVLRPMHAVAVNFTLDEIGGGAIGAGMINTFRDEDGITRRLPLAVEFGGQHYMPMGLAVALYDLGKTGDTSYLAGESTLRAGGRTLPLTRDASLFLDALGKKQFKTVSAADVLSGKADRAALKDKLVFLGMTYGSYDKVRTPLDSIVDGVELHATLAENFLTGRILGLAGKTTTVITALVLCLIVIGAQLRSVRRQAWVPPLVALAAFVAYLVVVQLMFSRGTIVQVAAPIAAASLVLAIATIGGLATEGREKAHLRSVFSRYVSRAVVDRIVQDPARAKLGGERKELTVLFSDIRGFSAFSERMGPEELASFLSEYLTPMTELVLESGGTLDKYIGDAVMAIWSAPVDMPDHAQRACEVALKMQAEVTELNKRWKTEGKPEIAIGIGINTGQMSVGNMGTSSRFDYTVLGDQVNLGARLEALTKEYGVDILVGEDTYKAASKQFVFREVDLVRVKGRAGAAPVYQLVGRTGTQVDPRFAEGLAAYRRRDFVTAQQLFGALDGDKTAAILAKRCAELAVYPPPPDWDGVYEQRSK